MSNLQTIIPHCGRVLDYASRDSIEMDTHHIFLNQMPRCINWSINATKICFINKMRWIPPYKMEIY